MSVRRMALAVAAGLALADASIVTLALPDILRELDTTTEGVAAVIGLYTLVIAVVLLPFERLAARWSVRVTGAGGFALMAAASGACAVANALPVLLLARGAQALGAAAGLATVFELLGGASGRGRTLWVWTAIFGTAVGPAIGGALTQAFSWRAIFVFQIPIAAAGAIAVLAGPARAPAVDPEPSTQGPRFAWRPAASLGLVSASLSAVLFLLVLLLVAGWNVSPLGAAAALSQGVTIARPNATVPNTTATATTNVCSRPTGPASAPAMAKPSAATANRAAVNSSALMNTRRPAERSAGGRSRSVNAPPNSNAGISAAAIWKNWL